MRERCRTPQIHVAATPKKENCPTPRLISGPGSERDDDNGTPKTTVKAAEERRRGAECAPGAIPGRRSTACLMRIAAIVSAVVVDATHDPGASRRDDDGAAAVRSAVVAHGRADEAAGAKGVADIELHA